MLSKHTTKSCMLGNLLNIAKKNIIDFNLLNVAKKNIIDFKLPFHEHKIVQREDMPGIPPSLVTNSFSHE